MLLSNEDSEKLACTVLNEFLFDRVWNEPVSEYRSNIRPQLLHRGSVIGSINLVDTSLELPNRNDRFYMWFVHVSDLTLKLNLPEGQWLDTATIANEYNTLFHVYGTNGKLFNKSTVYFRFNKSSSILFIAAEKNMVKNCIAYADIENLFFTIYYASDNVIRPVDVLSFHYGDKRDQNSVLLAIQNFLIKVEKESQLLVFENGVEITNGISGYNPVLGNYYDFILDRSVVFDFELDLVTTGEDPVFLSTADEIWKQIIHIPKALNPNNKIYTHNTCDIIVRKRNSIGNGRYLHRSSYDRTVGQITHNDFSVPLFILDAYRDYMGTQDIKLRVLVREHEKDNTLLRDSNYIDLLYSGHSDEDIVRILSGKGPEEIPWWRAEVLEQSEYVKMMFDTPSLAITSNMQRYIDALGFYQVANLLCKRMVDFTLDKDTERNFSIPYPVLYYGMEVFPVVYVNGQVLSSDFYSYKTNLREIGISIFDEVHLKENDRISIVLYIDSESKHITFTPTEFTVSVTVPFEEVLIYKKTVTSDTSIPKGVSGGSEIVYTQLLPNNNEYISEITDDGQNILRFNTNFVGSELVIFNEYCSYHQRFNLDEFTSTGSNIAIPLESDGVPIIGFKNMLVLLNGRYLVKDIDYTINTVMDSKGNIAFRELIIQAMDYFVEGQKDVLDVLLNIAEIEDISSSFVLDKKLTDNSPVNLYFPNISTVHINGALQRDVKYLGTYIEVSDSSFEGKPFEIQTSIPALVKDFINKYSSNEDIKRIGILNAYFNTKPIVNKPVIVLENKHRLYSVYMNAIITDIVAGKIAFVNDPDFNRMNDQLKVYDYLKDIDLCFSDIDRRFVDFYPQYINYEVSPEMKQLIDLLIEKLMPENLYPTLETVYE